jgi:hypothetical protein
MRLHSVSFRQFVESDPFVDAPPTQAKLPRDVSYLQASGSHLLDGLKELQFLLQPLPGNFHLLHHDAGSDSDRLDLTLHFPLCRRWRQCRLVQSQHETTTDSLELVSKKP